MIKEHKNIRRTLFFLVVAASAALFCSLAYAGGPLFVINGQPVRWQRSEVRGGPLNTQTIDAAGHVLYRVDSGPLGTLSNAQATSLVDRIFGLYSNIPTADIQFVNGGPILDPATGNPVDVTSSNAGKFISARNPTFQNPIVFDSDGSITGGGGILGFFGFTQLDENAGALQEAFVVLNGAVLSGKHRLSVPAFLGVFTHEFGHFAGPLDHEQSNGNIAMSGAGSVLPPGFSSAQAFDLFAPFTETLFPFIFDAPTGSQLGSQFANSGFFVASLDLDTQNAVSNLYPKPEYLASRGSIEGQVVIKAGGSVIPIAGINVIARRIDQSAFPPLVGTTAFVVPPAVDSLGVPESPPAQAATDSLASVSSAVTGLEFGQGTYRVQGLPPGQYLVEIQRINKDAVAGSGIGPLNVPFPLPLPEEFFDGPGISSSSASIFLPVTVSAGQVTSGIDFVINGFSTDAPTLVNEKEPNEKKKKAQKLTIPVDVLAAASSTDDSLLRMDLPDGSSDSIEDLYQITVDQVRTVLIILEPTSGTGDLDLYLFTSDVSKKRSSLDDPNLVTFSAGPTANELIAFSLSPGTYVIGVSAFSGSMNYRLRVLTTAQ